MGLKTSGDTMQSPNNSSRRCAHVSVIFSPSGFALPMVGAGREAIVFTARYVMQRGAKAGHTVGLCAGPAGRPTREDDDELCRGTHGGESQASPLNLSLFVED